MSEKYSHQGIDNFEESEFSEEIQLKRLKNQTRNQIIQKLGNLANANKPVKIEVQDVGNSKEDSSETNFDKIMENEDFSSFEEPPKTQISVQSRSQPKTQIKKDKKPKPRSKPIKILRQVQNPVPIRPPSFQRLAPPPQMASNSEFKEPTKEEVYLAIQCIKERLPYCSIERLIIHLYKLMIPKGYNIDQVTDPRSEILELNGGMSKPPPMMQVPSGFHHKSLKMSTLRDSRLDSEVDSQEYNSTKSMARMKSQLSKHQAYYEKARAMKAQLRRPQHCGGWLKRYQHSQDFTRHQQIAQVFLEYGPASQTANSYLQENLQLKRCYNNYRNMCRATFRKIEQYMIEELKIDIRFLQKDNLTFMTTPLIRCREWMGNEMIDVFFNFIRMLYKFPYVKPERKEVEKFYSICLKVLEEKLVKYYERKGIEPKQYMKANKFLAESKQWIPEQKVQDDTKLLQLIDDLDYLDPERSKFDAKSQRGEKFQIYDQDQDQVNGVKQSIKFIEKQEIHKSEIILKDQYKDPNFMDNFWTEDLQRVLAESYINLRKHALVRQEIAAQYPNECCNLETKDVKARLEKMCRQGLKKVQAMWSKYRNSEGIPELPPINDILIKLILRSPQGSDLRANFINVLIQDSEDIISFREAVKQLFKFVKQKKLEIVQEFDKDYNRGKIKSKDLEYYVNMVNEDNYVEQF